MKKTLLFFTVFCLFTLKFYGQTVEYYSENGRLILSSVGNEYKLIIFDSNYEIIDNQHGLVTYQNDSYGNKIMICVSDSNETHKYRYYQFDDFIFLYENSEIPFFIGNSESSRLLESLISVDITSSSYLSEKTKVYKADKLSYWGNLNYVWAEGQSDCGEGEKLFTDKVCFKTLYILPGYVSVKRPDLYKKNCRPKKIKIKTSTKSYSFELEDIPEFQKLSFPEVVNDKIEIEILEVYKGSDYEDLCISSILFRKGNLDE